MPGSPLEQVGWVLGMAVCILTMMGLVVAVVAVVRLLLARHRRRRQAANPARPVGAAPRRRVRLGSSGEGERGAGTVLVLGIAACAVVLGLGLAALGAAQQARGAAQSAADLGALAGATAARHGRDPCEVAREAVHRNGGKVASCAPEGGGVVGLTVTQGLPAFPALLTLPWVFWRAVDEGTPLSA